MFKMHNVGTVPMFKTHHVGTITNQNLFNNFKYIFFHKLEKAVRSKFYFISLR